MAPSATVFLADDDEHFRRLLSRELRRMGYDVVCAANGAQALELLSRAADGEGEIPDVVILDVMMPGYSGLGVLEAMRRFAVRPPTFLVTGFSDDSVHIIARRLGATRVLFKPIDLDELLEAILEAAKARTSRPPPP